MEFSRCFLKIYTASSFVIKKYHIGQFSVTNTMFSPVGKQIMVASSILLYMLGQGMLLGFTSCLLPALQAPDSSIKTSMETCSWLVATFGIGNMVAYLLSSVLLVVFGRRIAFGIILLPAIVGMLLTSIAANVAVLICGRFLAGLTAGATTIGAVVIGEYCSPQYRVIFINMMSAGLFIGSVIVHVLGYHMHWKTVAVLCIIPFFIALVITCTWPESPFWLAQRRRLNESEEILYQLRGTELDIKEFIKIQKDARRQHKRTFSEKIVELAKKFTQINFLQPLIIFVVAVILLETSGRYVFPAFATQIIIEITGHNSHTFYYNLVADVVFTSSALLSSYLIKIMKLRKLLLSTGLVSCILLACSYMYLALKDFIPKSYSAIPIALFGFYVCFGCTPVPLGLMGEIFPLEHRPVGSAMAGNILLIFITILLKTTSFISHGRPKADLLIHFMLPVLEFYETLVVLALCTALSLFSLYFMLPETKNRTLEFKNDDTLMYTKDVDLEMLSETESL